MADRLWSFQEIKFIRVYTNRYTSQEMAEELNKRFHGGEPVRTAIDVNQVKRQKSIF